MKSWYIGMCSFEKMHADILIFQFIAQEEWFGHEPPCKQCQVCWMVARGKTTSIKFCCKIESETEKIMLFIHFQAMPDKFMDEHQLSNIILEYRKECGSSDIIQSLSEPDEDNRTINGIQLKYTHILQTKGEVKNEEIVRARTTWRKKHSSMQFPMYQ